MNAQPLVGYTYTERRVPCTCDPVSPPAKLCGKHFPIDSPTFCRETVHRGGRITDVHRHAGTAEPLVVRFYCRVTSMTIITRHTVIYNQHFRMPIDIYDKNISIFMLFAIRDLSNKKYLQQ